MLRARPSECARAASAEARLEKRSPVCGQVAFGHRQVRQDTRNWNKSAVPDLGPRFPWMEFDAGLPDRANKYEPLLLPSDAVATRETEEATGEYIGTYLFAHFAAQRGLPILAVSRAAGWPIPMCAIGADEDDALVRRQAYPRRSVARAVGNEVRRVPRDYPFLAAVVNTHLLPVTNRAIRYRTTWQLLSVCSFLPSVCQSSHLPGPLTRTWFRCEYRCRPRKKKASRPSTEGHCR